MCGLCKIWGLTSPSCYGAFFFASRAVQCYGSRPSARARHESKLDQTHLLVHEILQYTYVVRLN